jgi:hypothetical protein
LSGLIRIILGIFLWAMAWKQWQQRPDSNQPVTAPKMLARLETIGTVHSLATGFLFTAINPKNLVLTATGAATIDSSMLAPNLQIIAFFIFITIASLTVALPLAAYFLARQGVEGTFARWKDWLIENNVAVLIVLLLVFGTLLIGRGMKIIAT